LIQIGTAFFLLRFNYIFSIIRRRTFLPVFFYLILVCCFSEFYLDWKGSLAALLMMVNYVFLFSAYQKPDSQLNALNISLILVLGSFFWPPFLIFFPILWIGFYWFHSLNLRVFLAGIIGFIVIYLFIFAWCVFQNDWENNLTIFRSFFPAFKEIFPVHKLNLSNYEWISFCLILLTHIIAGLSLFVVGISEKVKTVSHLKYLYILSFIIFALSLVQSE
jgi:hypothetical protein